MIASIRGILSLGMSVEEKGTKPFSNQAD